MSEGSLGSGAFTPRLVQGVPWLMDWWMAYSSADDYEAGLDYVEMGGLASELVSRLKNHDAQPMRGLFERVEGILGSANKGERKLVVVGFLEALQNVSLNEDVPLQTWHPLLGPLARQAWHDLQLLWQGGLSPVEFNRRYDP